MGGCVRSALLGPNELAPIANLDGADGRADPLSAGVLCRDVLDDSPQIRTAENRGGAGNGSVGATSCKEIIRTPQRRIGRISNHGARSSRVLAPDAAPTELTTIFVLAAITISLPRRWLLGLLFQRIVGPPEVVEDVLPTGVIDGKRGKPVLLKISGPPGAIGVPGRRK